MFNHSLTPEQTRTLISSQYCDKPEPSGAMPSENQKVVLLMVGIALFLATQNSDLYGCLLALSFFFISLYASHPISFRLGAQIVLVKLLDLLEIIYHVVTAAIHYVTWFITAVVLLLVLYLVITAKRCLEDIAKATHERLYRMRGTIEQEHDIREQGVALVHRTLDQEGDQGPHAIQDERLDVKLDRRVRIGRGRQRTVLRDLYPNYSDEIVVDSKEAKDFEIAATAARNRTAEYEAQLKRLAAKKSRSSGKQERDEHAGNEAPHPTINIKLTAKPNTELTHESKNEAHETTVQAHNTVQSHENSGKHASTVGLQPTIEPQQDADTLYDWDSDTQFPADAYNQPQDYSRDRADTLSFATSPEPESTAEPEEDVLYDWDSDVEFGPHGTLEQPQVSTAQPIILLFIPEPEPEEDVLYDFESERNSPEPQYDVYMGGYSYQHREPSQEVQGDSDTIYENMTDYEQDETIDPDERYEPDFEFGQRTYNRAYE